MNPLGVDWSAIGGWNVAGGLALLLVWLVVSGRLVPRSTHRDTVAERDHYRAAGELKDNTITQLSAQNHELLVVGRVQVATMRAISPPPNPEEGPPS